MVRRRKVSVPGSSANLGPGYDVLAAAVSPSLELEVEESDSFSVDPGSDQLPSDESNLCVRAFKELHPVEGISFKVRSELPLSAGLGSSAAAIVAGLVAADHMFELALERDQLLHRAAQIEGHPDNVAASLYGGFVVCSEEQDGPRVDRIEPPSGLEAVAVIPREQQLSTEEARSAIPTELPIADVTTNLASTALLTLGLASGDWDLLARGLRDRVHQPRRSSLYPRSYELLGQAGELGAVGASISGAGPAVLFWVLWEQTGSVVEGLRTEVGDWAEVRRLQFASEGAAVVEL